jgi:uncharacterized protein YgiM (DUF1202 family)
VKKNILALALSAILILAAAVPAALATTTTTVKLPSSVTEANVRSGPGTKYSVVCKVADGDKIELIEVGASWTKVKAVKQDKTGYLKNSYIKDLSSEISPPASGTATAAHVNGKGVNLRKGAGTEYAKAKTLVDGAKLLVWEERGDWDYVTLLSGTKGWIAKTYMASGYAMVAKSQVNFRKSANGEIIRKLAKGTTVQVESVTGKWSKVKVDSETGYVYSSYLK